MAERLAAELAHAPGVRAGAGSEYVASRVVQVRLASAGKAQAAPFPGAGHHRESRATIDRAAGMQSPATPRAVSLRGGCYQAGGDPRSV